MTNDRKRQREVDSVIYSKKRPLSALLVKQITWFVPCKKRIQLNQTLANPKTDFRVHQTVIDRYMDGGLFE